MYLWIKAFHVIFMVTWFAGLFYLPRLFVYHAAATDPEGTERFKTMERKLFYGIMTPGAVLTIALGVWLMALRGIEWVISTPWLQVKLALIGVLVAYHLLLGHLVQRFANDANRHRQAYFRWINEFPVIILVAVVLLAVLKPTF